MSVNTSVDRPEPDTVVYYRRLSQWRWRTGVVAFDGEGVVNSYGIILAWDEIEWMRAGYGSRYEAPDRDIGEKL